MPQNEPFKGWPIGGDSASRDDGRVGGLTEGASGQSRFYITESPRTTPNATSEAKAIGASGQESRVGDGGGIKAAVNEKGGRGKILAGSGDG